MVIVEAVKYTWYYVYSKSNGIFSKKICRNSFSSSVKSKLRLECKTTLVDSCIPVSSMTSLGIYLIEKGGDSTKLALKTPTMAA